MASALLRAAPFLLLAGLFAAHYLQGLFARGDAFQAYAFFNYAYANLLAAGELPQWLPFAAYGAPAEPYSMTFLGPAQLLALGLGALLRLPDAWALFFCATFLEAAVLVRGMQLLARELYGSEETASAVACWTAGTVYWSTQIFWPHRVLLLVPLLLLHTLRFHRSGDLREALRAGQAAVLSLVGSLAYVAPMYGLLAVLFFAALRLADRRSGFARLQRPGLSALADVLLLLLLAGLYLLLFAGALDGAVVTSPSRSAAGGGSSLEVFLRYGESALMQLPELALGQWVGHAEFLFYLGVAGAGLLLYALWRVRSGVFLALCGVSAFWLLLSLGPHGLLAYAVYWLPGMSLFRHLSFLLPMVRLLLLLLAGFGLNHLLAQPGGNAGVSGGDVGSEAGAKRRDEAFTCLTLAALVLLGVKNLLLDWPNPVPELGFALLLGLRLLLALAERPGWRTGWGNGPVDRAVVLALGLLLTLELAGANQFLLARTNAFYTWEQRHAVGGLDLTRPQLHAYPASRPDAVEGLARRQALEELAARQAVNNFALLHLLGEDTCAPMVRVDYALPGVLEFLERASPGGLARTTLEYDFRKSRSFANWGQALADPQYREACGCDGDRLVLETADGRRLDLSASVRRFSANRLEVGVAAALAQAGGGAGQGARLSLADAYHPGWRALVDGSPAPVERARTAFKAVALPPGAQAVALAYFEPWREWARWALGLAGLLCLARLLCGVRLLCLFPGLGLRRG